MVLTYGLSKRPLHTLTGALGDVYVYRLVSVDYHKNNKSYTTSGLNLLSMVMPCRKGKSFEVLVASVCKHMG